MNENVTGAVTPIVIFVFKRPEHTARMLAALALNPRLVRHPLYIFCDGARNAVEVEAVESTRRRVLEFHHPNKTVVEQPDNQGLARSVIQGVTRLVNQYGRVIVLEDDLVVSTGFLDYMSDALDHFADKPQVMQVSGHAFPVPGFLADDAALLLPFVGSWGWATWSRAWGQFDAGAKGWEQLMRNQKLRRRFDLENAYPYSDMLLCQMHGKIDSWAIRWNWSVFKANGLVVYPSQSLVENIGFDGSGTHCSDGVQVNSEWSAYPGQWVWPQVIETDQQRFQQVRLAILHAQGGWFRRAAIQWRNRVRCWGFHFCHLFARGVNA